MVVCMCCVRASVSVRGNNNDGAEIHQQPIFIFIIYDYLAISNRGGDRRDCLVTLNEIVL